MNNTARYVDIVFLVIVLPVMAMIFPVERWYHNFTSYVVSVGIWLYALYFVNRLVTVPFMFGNRVRKMWAVVIIAASIGVTLLFSGVRLYTPKPNIHDIGIVRLFPTVEHYRQTIWSLFMIVESFSFAVGLLTQTNIQRSRRREVEAERDKAVLALYRAQIKPHFMFNTLNTLYGLFLMHSPKALESLEKFILMMRYIHTTARREMVPLAEEAEYIREYVELQTLRLGRDTSVRLDISVGPGEFMVPPMLLVTFVENCFKHGVSPAEPSEIHIILRQDGAEFLFRTVNHIFPATGHGEHMGIENCRKRLGLHYGDRYEFSAGAEDETYTVTLKIRQ